MIKAIDSSKQQRSEVGPGLVLSRKEEQRVVLTTAAGETIVVTVLEARGRRSRLHFAAPRSVAIVRHEAPERSEAA